MATSKKGGVLILDFKDEQTISSDDRNPTNLKKDWFSIIKKSKGKILTLINYEDAPSNSVRDDINTISYVSFQNDDLVILRVNSGTLIINKNKTAYYSEE